MSDDAVRFLWALPLTWVLEDRLGERFEVDVEPASYELHAVGDDVVIDGEPYRLVAKRGRMVVLER